MIAEEKPIQSQLFTLRVWVEEMGDGRSEIRGQVKHIPTGEVVFFREWSALQSFLTRSLPKEKTAGTNA